MPNFFKQLKGRRYDCSSINDYGVYIARYQLRFVGSRWVVCEDVYDGIIDNCDVNRPLMFCEYETAYLSLFRLAKDYEKAGLKIPDFEIVAIDFRGDNCYCVRFDDREIEIIGKSYHLSQLLKKE